MEVIMDEQIIFSLLEQKNFKELKPILAEMNGTDVAHILSEIDENDLPVVFRLLPKDLAAETFVEMDSDLQEILIRRFSDKELKQIMDELYVDDAVDLVEEMPANLVRRILQQADAETRSAINTILQYPEDSAGSIMTTEYVYLYPEMTVEQSFAQIRANGVDKETIYTCYVIDKSRHLLGLVTVKDLLLHPYQTVIEDIMEDNVIYIETHADKETAAQMFDKYSFLAIPVVDSEVRLVGIITIDDAMDVLQEENTEDIAKMAAVKPSDKPYLKTSVFAIWRNRIPWLLVLMVSATFTGLILNNFEAKLTLISTVLFACVPMIMDTGGNAGSQASVTVIRALALNEITTKDFLKVVWKEVRASVLLATSLALACFAKLMLIDNLLFGYHDYTPFTCLVVSIALMCTVVIAKLVGCMLPMLAKKVKLDPAVVASPFITTIVDALSLLIYCGLAVVLLG